LSFIIFTRYSSSLKLKSFKIEENFWPTYQAGLYFKNSTSLNIQVEIFSEEKINKIKRNKKKIRRAWKNKKVRISKVQRGN